MNTIESSRFITHSNELPDSHRPNRPFFVCVGLKNRVKPRDAIGGKEEEPALIVES